MIARTLPQILTTSSLLLLASLPLPGCNDARPQDARPQAHRRAATPARHEAAAAIPASIHIPDSVSYDEALRRIASRRDALAARYENDRGSRERAAVLDEARTLMLAAIDDEIFPFWYGTPWDFNGTTQIPGRGSIACGYFVTTVLRDAGVELARVKLAQQASEVIIRSLTTNDHIQRFSNVTIEKFVEGVRAWGAGVYVVGLDIHTGFIVANESDVYFVHASYVPPRAVVRERALESRILAGSKYRVLGKLSEDDRFVTRWLLKRKP